MRGSARCPSRGLQGTAIQQRHCSDAVERFPSGRRGAISSANGYDALRLPSTAVRGMVQLLSAWSRCRAAETIAARRSRCASGFVYASTSVAITRGG
jgi:hypothetical protein